MNNYMPKNGQSKRNEQILRKVQSPKTQPEKKVENRNRSISSKAIELVILKCPANKNPGPMASRMNFAKLFRGFNT